MRRHALLVAIVFGTLFAILTAVMVVGTASGAPPAVTRSVWSGCFCTVYIRDARTGVVRKFERREVRATTTADRPGTGRWGAWVEQKPQDPKARSWQLIEIPVTQGEVRAAMGAYVFDHLATKTRALVSKTYELSDSGYSISGVPGVIPPPTRRQPLLD